jgi:hypothetical protein
MINAEEGVFETDNDPICFTVGGDPIFILEQPEATPG